jgi:hypothetical protein
VAERALDAWIGKDVWVVIDDEEGEPYFGILEGWDERGVILRYTERAIRMREERGSEGACGRSAAARGRANPLCSCSPGLWCGT